LTKFEQFNLDYDELKEKILSVTDAQEQALFATQYAAYARVGEIVVGKCSENPPLTSDSVKETEDHLIITVLTEKTRRHRRVPVSKKKEKWLTDIVSAWVEVSEGLPLFPYSTFWAQKKFKKWFGTYRTHLLRHWATTHALQGHRTVERLQPDEIARLGGWTDLNTFYKYYSHYMVEDFLHKI